MSNYVAAAYHPKECVIRAANWMDNFFGRHRYGIHFPGNPPEEVYRPNEVWIPTDRVFVEAK